MRVTIIKLRGGGRLLPQSDLKLMRGTLSTKKFMGGETWFKVLDFQPASSYPCQHELYDPRLKKCDAENSVLVFSGLAQEDGAWVVQEWEVDVAPRDETPVGKGWLKPERRYSSTLEK